MSNPNTLLKIGLGGSVVAALCCFTPLLVILLGVVGLSALTGYLDYVLLPALAAFIALTLYALHKKRKANACCIAASKTGEK
ncbi:mercury resistance system transport protein MerF [Pseudomonas sp. sp1636]|uniref:mercury resistance system transport protein MerF n=1 Tax=Pseudomonas sp. sp1636 TaxID=3036707 RepID=UPI0025A6229B|nr:mercury resistance system transport protein MerF [Pseudomonas sp. sp1636]MDM8349493.1 mercury resistance system transport protein MerF [Pseudomonas sp. sp1636]